MENDVLFSLIEMLPHQSKCQVQHLVIHLIQEAKDANLIKAGQLEGLGSIMADDFDAPMKEFHDYMYNMNIEFINKIEKLPLKKQMELEQITDKMLVE